MYCSNCARQIDPQSAFCPYCGAPQASSAQAPAPPPYRQPAAPQPGQPAPQPNTPPAGYPSAQGYQPAPSFQQPPGYQPAANQPPPAGYSPAPPPAGYGQQPAYPQPQAYRPAPYPAAPVRPARPAKQKTAVDLVAGAFFLVLGLGTAIYFCLLLATGFGTFDKLLGGFTLSGLFGALGDTGGLQRFALPLLLTTAGAALGLVAGLSLVIGGIASLASGRGRKFAFSAVALMVVTLLLDILTLVLMNLWETLAAPLGETILASGLIYLFEAAFVVATLILLAVKKRARQKLFQPQPVAPATPEAAAPKPAATATAPVAPQPAPTPAQPAAPEVSQQPGPAPIAAPISAPEAPPASMPAAAAAPETPPTAPEAPVAPAMPSPPPAAGGDTPEVAP